MGWINGYEDPRPVCLPVLQGGGLYLYFADGHPVFLGGGRGAVMSEFDGVHDE